MIQRPPGRVVLFGSGEVSAEAQPIHDFVLKGVDPPVRAAIVETPAGFEPNSASVAGRLAEFLKVRLQNYRPEVTVVPARKRGTPFSPDDPAIVAPLLTANLRGATTLGKPCLEYSACPTPPRISTRFRERGDHRFEHLRDSGL